MPKPFSSFADVYSYIVRFTNYETMTDFRYTRDVLNLAPVRECLALLGNPDKKLKIIHIAGTKGKGSVAIMVASILRKAGYKMGLFTQPHLIRLNERISVNGNSISDDQFTEMMNFLYPHIEKLRKEGSALTFFDITTVLALAFFAREGVNFAVLEVGLGGRLDSTNVVCPVITAITSIGFEHTKQLGDTLGQIATEKAGIIKERIPVIVGAEDPEALASIKAVAESKSAPLFQIGEAFQLIPGRSEPTFMVETWRRSYDELLIPLLGSHQRKNAAIAVAIIEALNEKGVSNVSEDRIREGLAKVRVPARIEVISDRPMIILDGAHNPSSLAALRAVLESLPKRRVILLFGIQRDKDIRGCLEVILPLADAAIFTSTGNPRSTTPEELAKAARELGFSNVVTESNIEKAFTKVLSVTGEDDLLCITGSFYLAGEIASLREAKPAICSFL